MHVVLGGWRLLSRSLRRVIGVGTRLLSEEALEDGASRTIGRYMSLFITEEAVWWAATYSAARKTGKVHFIPIVMVDVACRSGRWGLGGRRGLSMVLTRRSILVSVCSSRIFSIRRAAATTSSIVLCPSFWTSAAKVRSRAPKKASKA